MGLTGGQVQSLVKLTVDRALPLVYAAELMGVKRRLIYDWIKSPTGMVYFTHRKEPDGLIYLRPNTKALYLLNLKAKLKLIPKPDSRATTYPNLSRFSTGSRVSPERKTAISLTKQVNEFKHWNPDTENMSDLNPYGEKCLDLFEQYKERINNTALLLIPNPEKDFYGSPILLSYNTRFTDPKKQGLIRKRYFSAWDGAVNKYKFGVFMTLTTDPKKFKNLWDANKHFQKNWNKLITYLRKTTGKDLKYICVREFQGNGRLHFHAAIFGIKYLIKSSKLSRIWNSYGQGKIVHIYAIKKDNNDNEFVWSRQKPNDSQGRKPADYVKKYILKAQYDENAQFQYWIYNSRLFTYSPTLITILSYYISKKWYIYVRNVNLLDEPFIKYDTGDILMLIEPSGDPPPFAAKTDNSIIEMMDMYLEKKA